MTAAFDKPYLALLRREVLATMRHPWTFLAIGLSVVGTSYFVVESWPEQQQTLQAQAMQANRVFYTFQYFAYAALFIFIPIIAANSIAQERRADSVDMLRMTAISSEGVIAGKMLNSVALFLVLLAANMPVLAVVLFLVGLEISLVLMGTLTAFAITVACALMAIYFSIRIPNVIRALIATYITTLLLAYIVAPIVFGLIGLLAAVLFALPSIAITGTGTGGWAWGMMIGTPLSITLLCYIAFRRAVEAWDSGVVKPQPPTQKKPIYKKADIRRRRATWPFYIFDPERRKPSMRDGLNPILQREMRWGVMQNATLMVRFFYVSLALYLVPTFQLMMLFGYRSPGRSLANVFMFELVVIALFVPAMLALNVIQEREQGNLDMLRMTLQSTKSIVIGKIMSGYQAASPFLLSSICAGIITCIWMRENALQFILVKAFFLLLMTGLCTGFGLFASLVAPRAVTSIVFAYVLTWGGLFLLPASFDWFSLYAVPDDFFSSAHALLQQSISGRAAESIVGYFSTVGYMLIALVFWAASVVLFEFRYARDH